MGSAHSIRSTHFQRPNKDASVENISDEEFDDQHSISISNKMVERLVEDATLAGGAATAAPTPKPKGEYRDKVYMEKLKCMDDNHSERCRMGYPRELCGLLSEVNTLHDRVGDISMKQADIFTFVSHCHLKIDECNDNLAILNEKLKALETHISRHQFFMTESIDHSKLALMQSLNGIAPPLNSLFPAIQSNQDFRKDPIEPCKDMDILHIANNDDFVNYKTSTEDKNEVVENESCHEVYRNNENQQHYEVPCTACGSCRSLKSSHEKKFIHICNITSDLNEVKAHLHHLCENRKCSVQQINCNGNNKSYKIGVPIEFYDKVLAQKFWPENALVRPWVTFRRNRHQQ